VNDGDGRSDACVNQQKPYPSMVGERSWVKKGMLLLAHDLKESQRGVARKTPKIRGSESQRTADQTWSKKKGEKEEGRKGSHDTERGDSADKVRKVFKVEA